MHGLNPFTGGGINPTDIMSHPIPFGHTVLYLVVALLLLAVSLAMQRSFAETVDQVLPARGWDRVGTHWGYTSALFGVFIFAARALAKKNGARELALHKERLTNKVLEDAAAGDARGVKRQKQQKSSGVVVSMEPTGAAPVMTSDGLHQPPLSVRMAPMRIPGSQQGNLSARTTFAI